MAGRRAGSRDVAPKIRGAFKRACILLDKGKEEGEGLTELMVESLKNDFKGTITALGKYVPIELDASITEVSLEDWLDALED